MTRKLLWLLPFVCYLVFTFWYTNTGGPLTNQEITAFLEHFKSVGYTEERLQNVERFMRNDTGRQFLMMNNIDLNEQPPTVTGAEPGESAEQLMGRYMEYMWPALLQRACHPVYMGRAVHGAMDLVGIEGAEAWDQAALMRYRSRRDIMAIATNPVFEERHDFKVAALTKTIAYPLEGELYLSDPRLLLAIILVALTALLDLALFARRR